MSWNTVLLWNVWLTCGSIVLSLVLSPLPAWSWVFVNAAVLVSTGLAQWLAPDQAGYLGAALCTGLVLAPLLMRARAARLARLERYDGAARLAAAVRVLHPFGGGGELAILRAHAHVAAGRLDEAIATFERCARGTGLFADVARANVLRLRGDWFAVLSMLEDRFDGRDASGGIVLLSHYLRALGESGRPDAVVRVFGQYSAALDRRGLESIRAASRVALFAYSGRSSGLERLILAGALGPRASSHRLWRGIAARSAGEQTAAESWLAPLAVGPDSVLRPIAARWLSPIAPESPSLTSEQLAVLRNVEAELEHELRLVPEGATPAAWVTRALLAANVAMFAVEWLMGGQGEAPEVLYTLGAVYTPLFDASESWRLITANFLHFGSAHLVMNAVGLAVLGPLPERLLGRVRFLLVYLAAGIAAMSAIVIVAALKWSDGAFIVGASGSVMGLVGAHGALLLYERRKTGAAVAKRQAQRILTIVVLQIVSDQLIPQVSGTAHLVGLVAGFGVTAALVWPFGGSAGQVVKIQV